MDDKLVDWDVIAGRYRNAILIGNGASRAVWSGFSYSSLFRKAALSGPDRALFDELGTENFETVLDCLRTAEVVRGHTEHSPGPLIAQHQRIRQALVDAVAEVHVDWASVPPATLLHMNDALRHYRFVFSTNYDLLVHWAEMADRFGFVDYFWGHEQRFDMADTHLQRGKTGILYVHGGLHLVRDSDGSARKRVARCAELLEDFTNADDVPLFVSEGTSRDRLQAIRRSDYLSFAYRTLATQADNLVVFGHSLSERDDHICQVLESRARRIAISVRRTERTTPESIIFEKARYAKALPATEIDFFDPATHPLGDPGLAVR
jgi:hypothetical protein